MTRPKNLCDSNRFAKAIVDLAAGQFEDAEPDRSMNAFARAVGLTGGKVRAAKLSPEERSQVAAKAAHARWREAECDSHG